MKIYKGKINKLEPNQVFVFGSNEYGINGNIYTGKGGSALHATINGWVEQGEIMNNCLSKSGKSWGIVTISYPGKKKSKTIEEISQNILKLYKYAINNPHKEFMIAYTGKSGYNLNGYSNKELAKCFSSYKIPNNICFEEDFSTLIDQLKQGFKL